MPPLEGRKRIIRSSGQVHERVEWFSAGNQIPSFAGHRFREHGVARRSAHAELTAFPIAEVHLAEIDGRDEIVVEPRN